MKVFISHKDADSVQALQIKKEFEKYDVPAYLDVLDNDIKLGGKQLTDHIKKNLNACSDIIVVMSDKTKLSLWVPFEIGMSAQVDMPTATYLNHSVTLPDYLTYWPRLRTLNDIALYVRIRRKVAAESRVLFEHYSVENRQRYETERFYAAIKEEMRR